MTDHRPKAYSYLRFSTPEQQQGDSFRRQTEMAEEYARREGLDLDASLTLHDKGVSAYRGKNADVGALKEFRRAVEAGDVAPGSFLLVENLDRLSRQEPWDALGPIQEIINAGITVVTLSDDKEYNRETLLGGMQGMMALMGMLMSFMRANEESAQKARRLRSAWGEKRKQASDSGKVLTKASPGWIEYDDEEESFRLIEDRAAIVRRIYEDTLAGEGQHAIAKALNREGVPTFGRSKQWHRSYVRKLLKDSSMAPAAVGTFVPHTLVQEDGKKRREPLEDQAVEGYYPAAVPEELWEDVQALQEGTAKGSTGGNAEAFNIFGSLAVCGRCGGTTTHVNKGQRRGSHGRYLVCAAAKSGAGCEYRSVPYHEVEEAFLKGAKKLLRHPPSGVADEGHADAELANLATNIDVAQERRDRVLDEIEARGSSPALRARLEQREQELEESREQRKALLQQQERTRPGMVARRVERLREALAEKELDRAKVNNRLRRVFKAVTVDRGAGILGFEWQQGGESQLRFREGEYEHYFGNDADGDDEAVA